MTTTMACQSTRQKTTSRYTYGVLDDFHILLGHVGIPHELYRSPKGRLFIRFQRPVEGDSVALQFRKEYLNFADRTVHPAHFKMFIGLYGDEVRQEVRTFAGTSEIAEFLGIDPEAVLAGERARGHLDRRLQAASINDLSRKVELQKPALPRNSRPQF